MITVSAFPNCVSSAAIIVASLAIHLLLLPWMKPRLVVISSSFVYPSISVLPNISVGPMSGVAEAVVFERNALPLILGKDWFCTAQAELHIKPSQLPVICHPTSNVTVHCKEELLPRMSNAVILTRYEFSKVRLCAFNT